jgi:GNAT superfamily N-acetyltransferase
MSLHTLDLGASTVSPGTRERLCRLYYDLIYRPAFPIADEAEDPTIWLPLMAGEPAWPKSQVHIVVATVGTSRPEEIEAASLVGGIHYEHFRESGAALITYLCVRGDRRRQGVATLLVTDAIADIRRTHGLIPVFAEAEDPDRLADRETRPAACVRLIILGRLGFREIPIRYPQPALGPGKRPVDHLKFLLFAGGQSATLKLSLLRAFMREFYASLDADLDEAAMFGGLTAADVPTLAMGQDA